MNDRTITIDKLKYKKLRKEIISLEKRNYVRKEFPTNKIIKIIIDMIDEVTNDN